MRNVCHTELSLLCTCSIVRLVISSLSQQPWELAGNQLQNSDLTVILVGDGTISVSHIDQRCFTLGDYRKVVPQECTECHLNRRGLGLGEGLERSGIGPLMGWQTASRRESFEPFNEMLKGSDQILASNLPTQGISQSVSSQTHPAFHVAFVASRKQHSVK